VPKPFADHFSDIAGQYAASRPTYPPELFDWLASVAPATDAVWDCAAGSGQATLELARRFDRVTATDASAAQLAQATVHPRVSYRVAPAEASGLPDRSIDLVTVAQALHWLDLDGFYAEVRRVLVPGGALAVWCYGLLMLDDSALDGRIREFYRGVVGPYWAPERKLVETGYRTLAFPFEELAAPPFEMTLDWTLAELAAYVGTWSATEAYRRARGQDPVPQLAAELTPRWGMAARRRVRWPLSVRVGRPARPA
jgi:ubiquinone/menaquinone biosynthesis C-methylase UbiE